MAHKNRHKDILAGVSSQAEEMLTQYLKDRGWRYLWGPQIGCKRPDAVILEDNRRIAVIEVTYLPSHDSRGKPKEVSFLKEALQKLDSGEILYACDFTKENLLMDVEERSSKKQAQADAASGQKLPFLLAMAGYGKRLRDIGSGVRTLLQNYPQVSALGMFHQTSALSVARRITRSANRGTERTQELLHWIHILLKKYWGSELTASNLTHSPPDLSILWMEILINPFATHPWPDDLFGVHDTVYEWSGNYKIVPVYEGTSKMLETYARYLLAGCIKVVEFTHTSRSENFYEEREPQIYSP
ncbi:MAG: hypothetical protein ACK4UU_02870 [Fimbriimonadales bacterium]